MAIAVLSALLIHIVWLARAYTHTDPANTRRVRAAAAGASLVVTAVLFCLIQSALTDILKIKFDSASGTRQVIKVIASPDNSICYAEIQALDDMAK